VPVVLRPGVCRVTLTTDQLTRRRQGIGASDVPAIVGLDSYRSPFDVWYAKTQVVPTGQLPESGPSRWGHLLEPVIAGEYARALDADVLLEESGTLEGAEPWILATPDRIVRRVGYDVRWLLEIKSRSTRTLRDWGESGTDHVPASVLCQVQWQMLVTGDERADVALFITDERQMRTYTVRRDQETIDMLAEECRLFWEGHVLANVAPEMVGQHVTDYVRDRFKVAGEGVRVASPDETSWIAELARLKAEAKANEEAQKPIITALQLAIGRDKGLRAENGDRATWSNVKGSAETNWQAVAEALKAPAALIQQHTTIKPGHRQLRVTAAGASE
jgi:putative phage-type endonuclease